MEMIYLHVGAVVTVEIVLFLLIGNAVLKGVRR